MCLCVCGKVLPSYLTLSLLTTLQIPFVSSGRFGTGKTHCGFHTPTHSLTPLSLSVTFEWASVVVKLSFVLPRSPLSSRFYGLQESLGLLIFHHLALSKLKRYTLVLASQTLFYSRLAFVSFVDSTTSNLLCRQSNFWTWKHKEAQVRHRY